MGKTNIQWCARHRIDPSGHCPHGATGEERCLDVECTRCWVKGYSANVWEGCTPVSAACKNCWAEAVAHRQGLDVWGPDKPRHITGEGVFASVRSWNRTAERTGQRRGVFWEDMGDLFEDRDDLAGRRAQAFEAMAAAPWLDHMLLTKRPENVLRMVPPGWRDAWPSWIWVGATTEDQETFERRATHLLAFAELGATTFLSIEPLLGEIDLDPPHCQNCWPRGTEEHGLADDGATPWCMNCDSEMCFGWFTGGDKSIALAIVGGESGASARPLDLAAAEGLAKQCADLHLPLFWKQMGSRWAQANGAHLVKGASHGQDPYRWPEWARRREMPEVET